MQHETTPNVQGEKTQLEARKTKVENMLQAEAQQLLKMRIVSICIRAWAIYRNLAPPGDFCRQPFRKSLPIIKGYSNQAVCKNPDAGINGEGAFFKMAAI